MCRKVRETSQLTKQMSKQYKVNEIFYSLQGKGYFTGTPAVFVRLSGCNRHCSFCDTDFSAHTLMSADEIACIAAKYPARHLVLTGGEPALQADDELINALHDKEFFISVETNGSLPLPASIDWITCSPKDKPWYLTVVDELKVLYEPGKDVESIASSFSPTHLFLQPCTYADGSSSTEATTEYILSHPHWRLSLQTHKLLNIR